MPGKVPYFVFKKARQSSIKSIKKYWKMLYKVVEGIVRPYVIDIQAVVPFMGHVIVIDKRQCLL